MYDVKKNTHDENEKFYEKRLKLLMTLIMNSINS